MLPSPSCPRAGQSGLWQNWSCGSIGDPSGARFGDHALRDAGWARVFQGVTPSSRFNGVLPWVQPTGEMSKVVRSAAKWRLMTRLLTLVANSPGGPVSQGLGKLGDTEKRNLQLLTSPLN